MILHIGYIIQTTNSAFDPNQLYPWQKWERYAKGRVLVGVDEADSTFASAGAIGGNKIQNHVLSGKGWAHTVIDGAYTYGSYRGVPGNKMTLRIRGATSQENAQSVSMPYGTPLGGVTDNADNLQPYIAVYMWRRIA